MASPKNCSTLCPRCGSTFDLLSWSTWLGFLSSGFEDAEVVLPKQQFSFLSSSCCYCRSLHSISPPDFVFIFAATGSRYLLGRFDSLKLHESTKSSKKNVLNRKREAGIKDKQTLWERLGKLHFIAHVSGCGMWSSCSRETTPESEIWIPGSFKLSFVVEQNDENVATYY